MDFNSVSSHCSSIIYACPVETNPQINTSIFTNLISEINSYITSSTNPLINTSIKQKCSNIETVIEKIKSNHNNLRSPELLDLFYYLNQLPFADCYLETTTLLFSDNQIHNLNFGLKLVLIKDSPYFKLKFQPSPNATENKRKREVLTETDESALVAKKAGIEANNNNVPIPSPTQLVEQDKKLTDNQPITTNKKTSIFKIPECTLQQFTNLIYANYGTLNSSLDSYVETVQLGQVFQLYPKNSIYKLIQELSGVRYPQDMTSLINEIQVKISQKLKPSDSDYKSKLSKIIRDTATPKEFLQIFPAEVIIMMLDHALPSQLRTLTRISSLFQEYLKIAIANKLNNNKRITTIFESHQDIENYLKIMGTTVTHLNCSNSKNTQDKFKLREKNFINIIGLCPQLSHLKIKRSDIGINFIEYLTRSHYINQLISLNLSESQGYLNNECMDVLARSNAESLKELHLFRTSITQRGLESLARSKTITLTKFSFQENSKQNGTIANLSRGISALVNSPIFRQLEILDLSGMGLNRQSKDVIHPIIQSILTATQLHALSKLYLHHIGFLDIDAEKLANCKNIPKLTHLDMSCNYGRFSSKLSKKGAKALINSTMFSLENLNLQGNDLEDKHYIALGIDMKTGNITKKGGSSRK